MDHYIVKTETDEFVLGVRPYNYLDRDSSNIDEKFQTVFVCLKREGNFYKVLAVDYTPDLAIELVQEPLLNELRNAEKVIILLYTVHETTSEEELKVKLLEVEKILKTYFDGKKIPISDLGEM